MARAEEIKEAIKLEEIQGVQPSVS
jgi:hypothetical protein